ncbi:MAG: glycosyltransferase [Balneolaceae bacterium]|nr:glycosyltransferase [Balneolaceae bacterium]
MPKIVCFSTSEWDNLQWTNRQNLMSRLGRKYEVLYIDPGIQSKRYYKRKLLENPLRFLFTWWKQTDGITVLSPVLLFLYRGPHLLRTLSWFILRQILSRHLREEQNSILWYYSPEAFAQTKDIPAVLKVYDCVDFYEESPYYGQREEEKERFLNLEKKTLKGVDLTIFTSKPLADKKGTFAKNFILEENVADVAIFKEKATFKKHQQGDRIDVFYVGAINSHKVDLSLVRRLDQEGFTTTMIGPIGGWGSSDKIDPHNLQNVRFLGPKDHKELPVYVAGSNVCIIPYNINGYTKGVFPLKLFEYLASGKPVVSTQLPSLADYDSLVYLSKDHDSFIDNIRKSVKEDSREKFSQRIEVASENSWEKKVERIDQNLKKLLDEHTH